MIEWWQIYIILKLDTIICFFGIVGGLLVIGLGIIFGCASCDMNDHGEAVRFFKQHTSKVKLAGIICIFCILISGLLPSSKQAIMMVGIPALVNNTRVQNIGNDSLKLLEQYIRQEMDEIELPEIPAGEEDE